jgi:predicted nuclease of predicted toxin-antitoxin system
MRFLVDECTGPAVAAWLRSAGFEVFSAYDQSQGASDSTILRRAFDEDWILITNDKDFGEMIFREQRQHRGVVFLRLSDERAPNKIAVLQKLLERHANRIPGNFITVTETSIRIS